MVLAEWLIIRFCEHSCSSWLITCKIVKTQLTRTDAESVDTTCVVNVLLEGFMFGIVSCVKNDP